MSRSTKLQIKLFVAISLVVVMLLVDGCRSLSSQDPAESFVSGKFPRDLDRIAGQKSELSLKMKEEIIRRHEEDSKNSKIFKVAVIDSGIDLAHPELYTQIQYHIENGQVMGAGIDIMGRDSFPSYVYVDPTLFAFGAQSVKDGRIVGEIASPLGLLREQNEIFVQRLLAGIKADPVLSQSLFAHLSSDNITLAGLFKSMSSKKSYEKLFSSSDYEEYKKDGKLIGVSTSVDKLDKETGKTTFSPQIAKVKEGWDLNLSKGLPRAFSNMNLIEHADVFYQLVEKTYKDFDSEFKYSENFQKMVDFRTVRVEKGEMSDYGKERLPEKLKDYLIESANFAILGYKAYDPIELLKQELEDFDKSKDSDKLSLVERVNLILAQLKVSLEVFEEASKDRDFRQKTAAIRKEIENLNSLSGVVSLLQDPSAEGQKLRSEIRRWIYRNKHPYISDETFSNSHQTHVSGIIARQNENIRIVPVKVTTSSVSRREGDTELQKRFLADLASWLKDPVVQEVVNQIHKEYGVKARAEASILKDVQTYLGKNPLNLVFIDEVLQAIQWVGEQKIKVANVSLGTLFKKDHNLANRNQSIAIDIFSEFARYRMGERVKQHAPQTVFFVATGNESGWADGISKTAFPVGVTSYRFKKIAEEKGMPASPNNTIKNMIAVGSINANQGTLTSFTNVLFDPNIPQIFSTGEEILSTVPGRAEGTETDKVLDKHFKTMSKTLSGGLSGLMDKDERKDQRSLSAKLVLLNASSLIDGIKGIWTAIGRSIYPARQTKMSGTSMATPMAAALVSDYLIEKAARLGVKEKDLYDHPEFTPEKIWEDIQKISKVNKVFPQLHLRILAESIEAWKKSSKPKELQTMMKGVIDSAKKAAPSVAKPLGQCAGLFLI